MKDIIYAKKGESDVRKAQRLQKQPRKCEAFIIFTKLMPVIAENQFLWSKNSISMPFDTAVRGGRKLQSLL